MDPMGNINVIIYPGQCMPISVPAVDRNCNTLLGIIPQNSRELRRRKRQWMRIPDLLGNPI